MMMFVLSNKNLYANLPKPVLMAGRNSTRIATSTWTVPRPGRMQRRSVRASHGEVFKDTWLLFTQRRRITL